MTKTRLLPMMSLMIISLLLGPGAEAATSESDVLGRYWLPERDGQFEIYRKDDRYFGRVIAYDIPEQLDGNNADKALRSRAFVGIDMLANFRFEEDDDQWVEGTIYDAENGKTYDCFLWFEEGSPGVLQARGFIGFSFLGRTERFTRVEP